MPDTPAISKTLRQRKRRRWLFRGIALLCGLLFALVVAEVATRMLGEHDADGNFFFKRKAVGGIHPQVAWVSCAALPSSRYYKLAQKYLPLGAGSVFTLGLKGGYAAGVKMVESCELLSHLVKSGRIYQALVFTRTKHGADRLARQLEIDGISAVAIHGNKSQASACAR